MKCECCGCPQATCPECGTTFPKLTRQKIYCSHKCASDVQNRKVREERKRKRLGMKCEICGERFDGTTPRQKYCSPKCKRRAHYLLCGRYAHCDKILKLDIPDDEKQERIRRIIGDFDDDADIDKLTVEIREKWTQAELERRKVGPPRGSNGDV